MNRDPTPAERAHLAAVTAVWSIVVLVLTMLLCAWMVVPHLAFFVIAPFPIALGFWLADLWTPNLRQGR
jgi:amino acid transporter